MVSLQSPHYIVCSIDHGGSPSGKSRASSTSVHDGRSRCPLQHRRPHAWSHERIYQKVLRQLSICTPRCFLGNSGCWELVSAVPFHQLPHHPTVSRNGFPTTCRGRLTALEARGILAAEIKHPGTRVMIRCTCPLDHAHFAGLRRTDNIIDGIKVSLLANFAAVIALVIRMEYCVSVGPHTRFSSVSLRGSSYMSFTFAVH